MMLWGLADWEATIIVSIIGGVGTVVATLLSVVPHFLPEKERPEKERGEEGQAENCRLKLQLAERVASIERENAARDERMANVIRSLDELRADSKQTVAMLQTMMRDRKGG